MQYCNFTTLLLGFFFLIHSSLWAQSHDYPEVEASRFDFGKMWTFEHAPLAYFQETYGFTATQEWLTRTRMASLRFATYCSASFVSPSGLIMTNHHCSRGEMGKIMEEGEDFSADGFYAATQGEERRVPGLFVKQLVQMQDITDMVNLRMNELADTDNPIAERDALIRTLIAEFESIPGWEGLEIESVSYYNGGRFSLYGYKRFDDIRLVWYPELDLGYFGGDPDNFTYPRYNLDATFFRAYENDEPVNTADFYFPFNADGIHDGEVVFITGNPGNTERYRTMAQLEYDRDYRYRIQLEFMRNRHAILTAEQAVNPSFAIQEQLFRLGNGIKAIGGIVEGLHNPELMGKKVTMERSIRAQVDNDDIWNELAEYTGQMKPHAAEVTLLSPGAMGGKVVQLMHQAYNYQTALANEAEAEELETLKAQMRNTAEGLNTPMQLAILTSVLEELLTFSKHADDYAAVIPDGHDAQSWAKHVMRNTFFADAAQLKSMLEADAASWAGSNDPVLVMSRVMIPRYNEALSFFRGTLASRRALEGKIGGKVYSIYGLAIPPDATFTLRLADGIVTGYNYNGTVAPVVTTYFGLYDRHYSHGGEYPWSLPERWMDPPMELLRTPYNFVSNNDIIGGNSGSPVINTRGEAVGLVFDGNIESLPGNFIYNPEMNRSVSVHAGGIIAALRYIYKADRLVQELESR